MVNINIMDNKINIQFTSDNHLEFYDDNIDYKTWLTPCAPYLAVLGDLGYPSMTNFRKFFEQVSQVYEKVFYVSGNHEYYICKNRQLQTLEQVDKEIQEICDSFLNVYYLNNKEHHLTDNIVILGTTLWSFIPANKKELMRYQINDYVYIYTTIDNIVAKITPSNTTNAHVKNVIWLSRKIEEYKDKQIIILSHHLPSFQLIHKDYQGNDMNCAFASDLDYLMNRHKHIKYWLCGHTHRNVYSKINECQCMTNPSGYKSDNNKEYDKQKVITL
ncbi:metallophosphoesterase [Fadolivirus algeromassiliense]|uniref:Metallophosphoesterase n=1 Tax=Fadolivirus FV1/VV64 TaxID=3070911 RepID=A0A7D3R2I6_9VIRU|nr:metallophosphoesterase [Fadolivirus algeromassiliense]QKF94538.1 metallophosphoesterase [Fadolivirus FV1/VV64]